MADILEYLAWRGDIPFSLMGLNDVDALVFSALSYVRYEGLVPMDFSVTAPVRTVARTILALTRPEERCRIAKDLQLLEAVAQSERFGRVKITGYRCVFIPEEETQFAAMTFVLDDGTAVVTFRGTDNTLVGWKEDFNMSFLQSIPAQRLARKYTEDLAREWSGTFYLNGHSKGGNLAIYAAAKSDPSVQDRIRTVYNQDGPGFMEAMLQDPGYQRIVPKIRTFVPRNSVIGMLLEREEPILVIRSDAMGLLQHELYSWQVSGKELVAEEDLAESSRSLDRTLTTWLAGMSQTERNEFIDGMFELLMLENAQRPKDVLRPQNIVASIRTLYGDGTKRKMMSAVLQELVNSARSHITAQDKA